MLEIHGCIAEGGFDDGGEIVIVLDEQDVGGAFAGVEDAAELGEEELLVEGLLNPALGVAGELGTEAGGEDTEDDDRDVRGLGVGAKSLEGLPTGEAGHVEIEEDGFDTVFGSEVERLLAGGGLDARCSPDG